MLDGSIYEGRVTSFFEARRGLVRTDGRLVIGGEGGGGILLREHSSGVNISSFCSECDPTALDDTVLFPNTDIFCPCPVASG